MSVDESGTLQQWLHQPLLEANFEHISNVGPTAYRIYVPTKESEYFHFVLLDLDDEDPYVMSSFGSSSVRRVEVEVAIGQKPEYEVVVFADKAWFREILPVSELRQFADPDIPIVLITASAMAIGAYAATTEHGVAAIRREMDELRERLDYLMDTDHWEIIHSGQVLPDQFITDAERALYLYDTEHLWNSMIGTAYRAAIWSWANDPVKPNLGDTPWQRIADVLKEYGNERGWEIQES